MHQLKKIQESTLLLVIFITIQILIGILAGRSAIFSTVWAWFLLVLGIFLIIQGKTKEANLVVAYLAASDVLWRMTHAHVFWEYSKYAIILLIGLLMVRERKTLKENYLLLGYIGFLIPAAILSFMELGLSAREEVSFNLSGPMVLFFCGTYYYRKIWLLENLKSLMLVFLAPVVSIATLCLMGLQEAGEIHFGTDSIAKATGGYGPNQVSMILGTGLLMLIFLASNSKNKAIMIAYAVVFLWVLSQALLSFSRGGVIFGLLAIFALIFIQFFQYSSSINNRRRKIIIGATVIGLLFFVFILPRLVSYTEGKISARYQEATTTGRIDLMYNDIRIAVKNPLLGVGTGMSKFYRDEGHLQGQPAHTEFTRLFSEHGLLGVISLIFLFTFFIRNVRKARSVLGKSLIVALIIVGIGSMGHAAMRLSAISFVLALTGINLVTLEKFFPLLFRRQYFKENIVPAS